VLGGRCTWKVNGLSGRNGPLTRPNERIHRRNRWNRWIQVKARPADLAALMTEVEADLQRQRRGAAPPGPTGWSKVGEAKDQPGEHLDR
jgi:hypothetical protein